MSSLYSYRPYDPVLSKIDITDKGFFYKNKPSKIYYWCSIMRINACRVKHADEYDGTNYFFKIYFSNGNKLKFKRSLENIDTFNHLDKALYDFLPDYNINWRDIVETESDKYSNNFIAFWQKFLPELLIGLKSITVFIKK